MEELEKLSATETNLNSGDVLQSRYRILHQLGHGGFSRTYLAEDINRFNEHCVLKEFAPQLQGTYAQEKALELFEREAVVLYRLQHPQIPQFRQLFRHNQEDEGGLFLVQDYVEGQTYHSLLNHRLKAGRKFSEAEISQLLDGVLPVLEYIHSMGVIHRDISPDNLILRSTDELPVLIDFGCIKEIEHKSHSQLIEAVSNTSVSLIGTALGKTGYAPPEQVERGVVDAHSDLYALAATAVVLLTGKEPQQLIDLNGYRWNWQDEVILSSKLEWVLTTMLAPNPSDRFSSAIEVINILQGIPFVAPSDKSIERTAPSALSIRKNAFSNLFNGQTPSKMVTLRCSRHKLQFFSSLVVVLILGGFLCLKLQDVGIFAPITSNSVRVDSQLQERFSNGERVLISQSNTPEKELAVAAFAQGNYNEAVSLFLASLKTVANDPEALIYLNNARIGREKSYHIAVSIPIGSDVNAAKEILRGVAQAQYQLNQAGGIDPVPLKVQIINDDNEPEIAKQIAKTLSQNQEILGVVGHYASDVTLATAPVYQSGKLVAISPISTSVKLSNLSPYIFRTVPNDHIAARALARYMLEKNQQQKAAVFYNSQSNYSQSLKSEFVTAVSLGGGQIVNTFDLSDANFSAANSFKQAVDAGAETIMLAANTSTLDKALQVIRVNRQRLSLLGGDDVYTPKTLEIAGEQGENLVLAIPWHIRANPEREFSQTAGKLWGGEVNWRTAMAYDATQALIKAIARNPTRIGVKKALAEPNFDVSGANNPVRFASSGDRFGNIQLVKMQFSNNNFGYEFVPID